MPRLELRDAGELGEAAPAQRLVGGGDAAVVVRLAQEEDRQHQARRRLRRVHPERDGPRLGRQHERRQEGAHVL